MLDTRSLKILRFQKCRIDGVIQILRVLLKLVDGHMVNRMVYMRSSDVSAIELRLPTQLPTQLPLVLLLLLESAQEVIYTQHVAIFRYSLLLQKPFRVRIFETVVLLVFASLYWVYVELFPLASGSITSLLSGARAEVVS